MSETRTRLTLLEAIDAAKTEPTATATLYLDGAAWTEAKTLRAALQKAKGLRDQSLKSDIPRLTSQLDQCQATLAESALVFTFRQLPKTDAADLLDSHQAGKEDDMPFNTDTYPPALVQAACIGVTGVYTADGVTIDEIKGLYDRLGEAQTDELFRAAWTLQLEAPKPFTVPATGGTTDSGPSSTTATD